MKNKGLFSTLFIDLLKEQTTLNDAARGRMATLAQKWQSLDPNNAETLWDSFLKQALSYLSFVPSDSSSQPGMFPLYEDYGFSNCVSVLFLVPPDSNIDNTSVGNFYPAKLMAQLEQRNLNWGILTDGAKWRLYSVKSSRPFEDYVELPLDTALEDSDEAEYGLFERFFHIESFTANDLENDVSQQDESLRLTKCRLDGDRDKSEKVLDEKVKTPFLSQVDEVLQYICNGFIHDTQKTGEEYTEEERGEIFESAVKLIYRCLFLFYAEARKLLPSEPDKSDLYQSHSIQTICNEARKFRWGERNDTDQFDLWKHLKGLVDAVNEGDPEYGIMGYNGGLFDDQEEPFLGQHQLRNDFLARALYLLAFVEPMDNESSQEYVIPYEDLEVRHLGELYENILEYTVQLADADSYRRRSKKGVSILLASQTSKQTGDTLIQKGDVYFGESALERKQTGSYYTPESLVRFLNEKTIIQPLAEIFENKYRLRYQELLEQAKHGHTHDLRRGAAQSAAALVDQFVEQQVLNFKVCDPAMGSGHFLVDAANQMTRLVVAFLEEIPSVEGTNSSISSHPNEWRRQITRHCIYGVDLNPLAVTLAKLSLWLNCFASDHKLTFLDYHIRHGNSLIGIRSLEQLAKIPMRKKDPKKKLQAKFQLSFPFGNFAQVLGEAASEVSQISYIDEDDTDTQKVMLEHALESMSDLRPIADLYTAYLMDSTVQHDDYKDLFERLAKGMSLSETLNFNLPGLMKKVENLKASHHYYHWPLEFPDVFVPGKEGGFSATVGNPPWDVISPNSGEFYQEYDPNFRKYRKQDANKVIEKLHDENPVIAQKWNAYRDHIEGQRGYLRNGAAYKCQGGGDINTFKLFLEQFFVLLSSVGKLGIIVPSSFYTDKGCRALRQMFFERSSIDFLYCLENRWPTVFPSVDGRFKFVVFSSKRGSKTTQFKCAFMEHDQERLWEIDNSPLKITVDQISLFSPDSMSVPEFKSEKELILAATRYKNNPSLASVLRENWDVNFKREFHMTGDSHLFIKSSERQLKDDIIPLIEGKQLWLLTNKFSEPNNWMEKNNTSLKPTSSKTRVVYRALAAATNERTFIVAVLPGGYPTAHTTNICPLPNEHALIVASIQSSMVWDWLVRSKVTTSISIFVLEQLPFPDYLAPSTNQAIPRSLLARGARLVCTDKSFARIWGSVFTRDWLSSEFWYPNTALSEKYGPIHEQDIRRHLSETSKLLKPEWDQHCAVLDHDSDRRDMGDRAQLRAEIDAYVAHLYGLSRDDFAYILDTFPVLKKKEMKAFGEFMSKRKSIEEYDRINIVLENSNGDSK
jgi:type I restriction-modification system DNA methylase subunit